MHSQFLDHVTQTSVVRIYEDEGYLRCFNGDRPIGRKMQLDQPRCRRHKKFVLDTYEGLRHDYTDKVCIVCHRRIPIR